MPLLKDDYTRTEKIDKEGYLWTIRREKYVLKSYWLQL